MEDHDVRAALRSRVARINTVEGSSVADSLSWRRYSEILDYHNVKPDDEGGPENGH